MTPWVGSIRKGNKFLVINLSRVPTKVRFFSSHRNWMMFAFQKGGFQVTEEASSVSRLVIIKIYIHLKRTKRL